MKSKQLLYIEFTDHLMKDKTPSLYFNNEYTVEQMKIYPYKMLLELKKAEQSKKHHPEGNVWNHTMLVLDQAASIKERSREPLVFMWAALLHDLGKPVVTQVRKGRITAYNHDREGAKLAREFLEALTLDYCFIHKVEALVRWHMQILYVLRDLPFQNIEAMLKDVDINEVALLSWCDRMGRGGVDTGLERENVRKFIEICENYKKGVDKTKNSIYNLT